MCWLTMRWKLDVYNLSHLLSQADSSLNKTQLKQSLPGFAYVSGGTDLVSLQGDSDFFFKVLWFTQ